MNGFAHAQGGGLVLAIAAFQDDSGPCGPSTPVEARLVKALVGASFGSACGSLPDLIEPALHPNHRQFFHSVAFGLVLIGGLRQAYQWQPDEPWQRVVRGAALIAGGAYLVHLAMDATTPKSLPLIGKI